MKNWTGRKILMFNTNLRDLIVHPKYHMGINNQTYCAFISINTLFLPYFLYNPCI